MTVRWQARFLVCLLFCACGPSPESGPDAAPPDRPDGSVAMPDLEGAWIFENVSATPTQMGFHPESGVLDNGDPWVVWAEVDEVELFDMDIFVAERQQNLWSSIPITTDDAVQHTFPSMVVDGNQAFVVWTGREQAGADLDVFLSIGTDSNWTQPIDVTSFGESSEVRDEIRPEVAISDQGLLVIAYVSSPVGGGVLDSEVRVITVSKTGTPSTPQTVTTGIDNCTALDAAASPLGFHVAARCSGGMFYASDESGTWLNQPLAADISGAFTPALAVDGEGFVHAVWAEDAGGNDDIFHAFRDGPGPFSTPRNITQTPDNNDTKPTIAIDKFGRTVVAWQDTDDDDVKMTFADDTLFSPAINLTPQSPESRDQSPSIAFDPDTGVPTIVIERSFVGSDPINVDVFALRLAN